MMQPASPSIRILSLLCLLLLGTPAAAQRQVSVGEPVTGQLSPDDPAREYGQRYHIYHFRPPAARPYLVRLRSVEFDAFVMAGPPDGTTCQSCHWDDDDGLGGTDAAVSIDAAPGEVYMILATTSGPGQTGRYTLLVEEYDPKAEFEIAIDTVAAGAEADTIDHPTLWTWASPDSGVLAQGDSVDENGVRYDPWRYDADEGEEITFSMSSEAFDPVLRVGRYDGDGVWREMWRDDNGGGGTDSRMTIIFPRRGTYELRAGSADGGSGAYTLSALSEERVEEEEEAEAAPWVPQWFTGSITGGQTVRARLEDADLRDPYGAVEDLWSYEGVAGDTLEIHMVSGDFTPALRVMMHRGGGAWEEIALALGGDDGSRLIVELPLHGQYAIGAAAPRFEARGEYTLSVTVR